MQRSALPFHVIRMSRRNGEISRSTDSEQSGLANISSQSPTIKLKVSTICFDSFRRGSF
jgi:hypothetical protein